MTKRNLGINTLFCTVLLFCVSSQATAEFYAVTTEIGYQGTVWNITQGTGPWTTSTPRDGYLYVTDGAGGTDYNVLMSNWAEHAASNVCDSFLQLYDEGHVTVTSAAGGWDASLKTFTMTVSGANADYDNSWARFWQPDVFTSSGAAAAWAVLFTDYTYSFTAQFDSPAVVDSGWYVNSDAHPNSITGSFSGHFVALMDGDKNPITGGDTYGFNIIFSKDLFVPLNGDAQPINEFGAVVPLPGAALLGLLGLSVAGVKLRKRA